MRKVAIDQAATALERARETVRDMESATNLSEVETAWSEFLGLSQRIHSKLEQGAKGESQSYNWWGGVQHNRRTDPVLRYTHHARNADHHGLAPVTELEPGSISAGIGPGSWGVEAKIGSGGGEIKIAPLGGQVPGKSKILEVKPASIKLVEVIDRGVRYSPPNGEDGNPLTPISAAQFTLERLTKIVEEAKQLPEHS